MAGAQSRTVLYIDVVAVEILPKHAWDVAVGPVVVQVGREARPFGQRARPLRHDVATADANVAARVLSDAAIVQIALQGDAARARRLPIHPEPTLPQVPVVGGVLAAGERRRVTIEPSAVDARANMRAQRCSVAYGAEAVLLGATATREQESLRVLGVLRNDIDDAVDGVGAPQRGPGSADDLDPVDVLKGDLLHIPEHTGEQRGVDGATIDEHQQLVGGGAVEAARADGPLA